MQIYEAQLKQLLDATLQLQIPLLKRKILKSKLITLMNWKKRKPKVNGGKNRKYKAKINETHNFKIDKFNEISTLSFENFKNSWQNLTLFNLEKHEKI